MPADGFLEETLHGDHLQAHPDPADIWLDQPNHISAHDLSHTEWLSPTHILMRDAK